MLICQDVIIIKYEHLVHDTFMNILPIIQNILLKDK